MKDLTKIKTPFGLLGKKTRKALVAHFEAGGKIEVFFFDTWMPSNFRPSSALQIYRAKPADKITIHTAAVEAPHPVFAAVKEWQEARRDWVHGKIPPTSWDAACVALYAIVVPS